ncbi:ATP synthase subunit B [Helicobacter trogontum]|uniref:ATP synthase subunit b n=1 Tax=Helicobacter trogontum TaxID=50960 RepID=A0A4U8TB48_9HELI|nr:ATP synthase subunit B [Helicobacter trogontum]MDY5185096.1 hypothetical protein [Helicobacter trogontum]TLD96398.1 hypothetical protein LS80_008535 [Helicobacter trogontum]
MRYIYMTLTCFVLCGVSYASGEAHVMDISKTDIIERLINFVIFVALMWYLLSDKLKAILQERTKSIANRLSQTQEKVNEIRAKKEKAQQRLKEAKEQAAEIISTAKKEANASVLRIEEKTKAQIANLLKANEEAMEFQEKILQKQLVAEILQEAFVSPALTLETRDYVEILEKKVV